MLSLILPTYNEAENIPRIVPELEAILKEIPHEIIVVDDDSPDGTWRVARELSRGNDRLRVLRRVGRRGLSSAVIEGFLAAKGDVLGVTDADGQHDYALLPALYRTVKEKGGLAIGSRYTAGGSVGEWDGRRQWMSRMATGLARRLCRVPVTDPMSGFFAVARSVFEGVLPRLNPKGFKILLDLLLHVPRGTPGAELPYTFRSRTLGQSKMSFTVQLEFLEELFDATLGRFLPLTFVKYCLVGAMGMVVTLLGLRAAVVVLALAGWRDDFLVELLAGIEAAIVFNFLLNNIWTFGRQRLRGWGAVLGFIRYNAVCLVGALATLSVASSLRSGGIDEFLSVAAAGFLGAVWNYTMSRLFTWTA
ncbi:MAG: glycosyltransferase family 2 protein [Patescibacteria group bacterium]